MKTHKIVSAPRTANAYVPINQVANYFLQRTDVSAGDVLTHLKLQKLCYFAQVCNLVNGRGALFEDRFQAWSHGPVALKLWQRFRKFTWKAIDAGNCGSLATSALSDDDKTILDAVWSRLGHWMARDLEYWTHQHAPWKHARGKARLGEHCTAEISLAALKKFYCTDEFRKKFAI